MMFDELRTSEDGTQYFRASLWFKEDSRHIDFGQALTQLYDSEVKLKRRGELAKNAIDDLISWLWADYALLPRTYFTCQHPNDRDERFYLSTFEDNFGYETKEYLSGSVGIPMWAELSIEYIDLESTVFDQTLEDHWGSQNFVSNWGERFLSSEGSATALIYASENSARGDLIYNPNLKDINKHIIQSDPNWYHDQSTYYNWLDFEVTVDKKEIEREQKLIGSSYGSLSDEQRANLVSAAIELMKFHELEEQKVPQYLLTLILNHPATAKELKAQIARLVDPYIIKIED